MAVDAKRYRFTRADYHEMGRAGIFKPGVHVELIDGDVIEMFPMGRHHRSIVDRLSHILTPRVRVTSIVRVRGPIVLGNYDEPEPDLTLLRFRADF